MGPAETLCVFYCSQHSGSGHYDTAVSSSLSRPLRCGLSVMTTRWRFVIYEQRQAKSLVGVCVCVSVCVRCVCVYVGWGGGVYTMCECVCVCVGVWVCVG